MFTFNAITMKWKIFFTLFSIAALLPHETSVLACGFYSDEEEMRFMLLNPDLSNKKVWWSYFYNRRYLYLYGDTVVNDDEYALSKEWKDKIDTNEKLFTVHDCIFGVLSDSALDKNSFYSALKKNVSAQKYFELARKSGEVSIAHTDWEPDNSWAREAKRTKLIASTKELLQQETDVFFKRKYAFQLIKLAYYNSDWDVLDAMCKKYFTSSSSRDVLYWWATHYKSMAFEKRDKIDSANYLHAIVFSNSTNKMRASKEFFSRRNIENVLALAKDDKERADIYLLAEIINPGRSLEGIKKVYELAPDHKHFGLLISREINKLEDWLGTARFSENRATIANYESDLEYLSEFTTFLSQAEDYRKRESNLYYIMLGYAYLLGNNNNAAKEQLAQIKAADENVKFQKAVLTTVLLAQSKDIRRNDVQDEIGKQFEYLISSRAMKFESQKILYSLSSYLRSLSAQKNLISIAGLFDNYASNKFCLTCHYNSFEYSMISYWDKYASSSDVKQLIDLYNKSSKNTLEKVLFKPYSNPNYLYDLLAVLYLRENKIEDAAKTLAQVPQQFWLSFRNASDNLDRDPFGENETLFDAPTMNLYSRREVVEKMIALEQEAAASPAKRAANYLKLGNAWYNFTQHSWFMVSYGRSQGSDINRNLDAVMLSRAHSYYKRALEYETSQEMKAKIAYMIAETATKGELKRYAKQYEQYANTEFYQSRNCTITKELSSF